MARHPERSTPREVLGAIAAVVSVVVLGGLFGWGFAVALDRDQRVRDRERTEVRTQVVTIDGTACTVVTRGQALQVVCPPRR